MKNPSFRDDLKALLAGGDDYYQVAGRARKRAASMRAAWSARTNVADVTPRSRHYHRVSSCSCAWCGLERDLRKQGMTPDEAHDAVARLWNRLSWGWRGPR